MITDPRTWLEILGSDECWQLLATVPVGRLAVVTDGQPEIFPVNFAVDGQAVVFRTQAGTKLAAVDGNPAVCFEADAIDTGTRSGWSVVIRGRAKAVRAPEHLRRLQALPLEYWAVGDKPDYVEITPTAVSGRRIHARASSA